MSYSKEYRKRTIEYLEEGHTWKETSRVFRITEATLNEWLKRYRETGSIETYNKGYQGRIDKEKLAAYVKKHPDAYQTEIAKAFECTPAAICIALKKMGYTRKKR